MVLGKRLAHKRVRAPGKKVAKAPSSSNRPGHCPSIDPAPAPPLEKATYAPPPPAPPTFPQPYAPPSHPTQAPSIVTYKPTVPSVHMETAVPTPVSTSGFCSPTDITITSPTPSGTPSAVSTPSTNPTPTSSGNLTPMETAQLIGQLQQHPPGFKSWLLRCQLPVEWLNVV